MREQDLKDLIRDILTNEATWLDVALENSADARFSDELRKGFGIAAGLVRFHAEHPELMVKDI